MIWKFSFFFLLTAINSKLLRHHNRHSTTLPVPGKRLPSIYSCFNHLTSSSFDNFLIPKVKKKREKWSNESMYLESWWLPRLDLNSNFAFIQSHNSPIITIITGYSMWISQILFEVSWMKFHFGFCVLFASWGEWRKGTIIGLNKTTIDI